MVNVDMVAACSRTPNEPPILGSRTQSSFVCSHDLLTCTSRRERAIVTGTFPRVSQRVQSGNPLTLREKGHANDDKVSSRRRCDDAWNERGHGCAPGGARRGYTRNSCDTGNVGERGDTCRSVDRNLGNTGNGRDHRRPGKSGTIFSTKLDDHE